MPTRHPIGMRKAREDRDFEIDGKLTKSVGPADRVLFSDTINKPTASSPAVELLTIADVARILKVSASSVRRLQQRRLIPFLKVGGAIRFASADLMSFLERQRVERVG
jgi:excisionase family DNA binding protein